MSILIIAVLAVFLLLEPSAGAGAEFYRWKDKEGREFFTNDRGKIPPEYREGASSVQPDEGRVSVGTKPAAARRSSDRVRDHKDKYGRGEDYWHGRASKLRQELNDLQSEYDLLLKREQDRDESPKKTAKRTKKSAANLDNRKAQLEKKIAGVKHRLEVDLPDEARKADAYPGWLRE